MTRFIVTIVKNLVSLVVSGWMIMLFEGDIARSHALYTIGFWETLLGLMIIGSTVGYATNIATGEVEANG